MTGINNNDRIGPPIPFDKELVPVLADLDGLVPKFDSMESIPGVRDAAMDAIDTFGIGRLKAAGVITVSVHTVPGSAGSPDITLVVVRPVSATKNAPAFYYTHGGGMIIGSAYEIIEDHLAWIQRFGFVLVSVEYRLAPETPDPGPIEDCYAGLVWTADHADELGIDADRIIVTGISAGGGLAAGTVLLARDRGGPNVAAQMLFCPMLDDRNDTASAIQGEGRGIWDRSANNTGWTALLGDRRGGDDVSPYAAPARATDLSRLPPTFIDVGSAETFRDEAVDYASRLWRAGVDAELHVFAGGFHGYANLAPQAAVSKDTQYVRTAWLSRFLTR